MSEHPHFCDCDACLNGGGTGAGMWVRGMGVSYHVLPGDDDRLLAMRLGRERLLARVRAGMYEAMRRRAASRRRKAA